LLCIFVKGLIFNGIIMQLNNRSFILRQNILQFIILLIYATIMVVIVFTATFEIFCSSLILIGLLTRIAAFPLIIIMVTAFVTTKWPIMVDKGFWAMAHEYRTDFAMTMLLIYLLNYGSGSLSIDSKINKSLKPEL